MTRHNLTVILISVLLSLFIWWRGNYKKINTDPRVKSLIFPTTNGWGYDILVNDSVFIHQENVPVVNGNCGFEKKEQAEKTAQLIINKIKKRELPIITIFELEKIIVTSNNQYAR